MKLPHCAEVHINLAAYFAARLQSENFKGGWNNHPLGLVIGSGDSFKGDQTFQSGLSTFGFVGNHSSDGTPENLSGSTEMEWTSGGFDITPER